jgi:hypothetical protein
MSRVKNMAVCLVPVTVNRDQHQPGEAFDPDLLDEKQIDAMIEKQIIKLEPREVADAPVSAAPKPKAKAGKKPAAKKEPPK